MTPQQSAQTAAQKAARQAAAAVRELNHLTRPGVGGLDVTDVYDVLAELALLATGLPQTLAQLETIVDRLTDADQVVVVDGENVGDPVAAAATMGYWTQIARDATGHAAHALDHAQQTLTWAARPSS